MKDIFPEYYHSPNLENLLNECLFVLDSCAILELYHSKKKDAIEAFQVLEDPQIINRLWIPHQVALEYQRNRYKRIIDYENANNIPESLGNINTRIDDVCGSIDKFKKILNNVSLIQEQNIDLEDIVNIANNAETDLKEIKRRFINIKKSYKPNYLCNDEIRDRIDKLFENKIGNPFTSKEYIEIYKEGEERYKNNIPPGYLDSKSKKTNKKYGDLIIWKQIINYAKSEKENIIFITNDEKEDWWFIQPYTNNKRLGPQAELVDEFVSETEREFHMFTFKEFLIEINDKLDLGRDSDALEHVGLTETGIIYQELNELSIAASALSNSNMLSEFHEMAETARMAQQVTLEAARAASALSNQNTLQKDDEKVNKEGNNVEENID